jgi:hypothetical protein
MNGECNGKIWKKWKRNYRLIQLASVQFQWIKYQLFFETRTVITDGLQN